ncbi:hypothetical protein LEP1GSC137_2257 [Leptospira borgpetersenii str. Noumea 25]|uniref:Uncharacterized protein n=1 Tax=Leptospira borgpetersenii serovar Ballum TaxID=280505 RepID=A0A0S2IMS0_LEPBO|nr:hypothetical protein LBBP_00408 [Leptospira borgpetersenii serovar Ballum]EKR02071.1 hypothetical protein LEP1GSC121_0709 [Leptospira borgpetersenii serovar Castellonis str. 200801910]EMO09840.1 hypothetical protein LEP1GSC137_2257 [Leptospira borgpetersenii str. Noumea 25]
MSWVEIFEVLKLRSKGIFSFVFSICCVIEKSRGSAFDWRDETDLYPELKYAEKLVQDELQSLHANQVIKQKTGT